ncbi:MAG: PEP-CTERM sorting domain-containing protein [Gemmatimonadaceae bacterium]|nr:PEP-CTERM sorting domain-containing protein [Gemmatimonadaceae bacterium]
MTVVRMRGPHGPLAALWLALLPAITQAQTVLFGGQLLQVNAKTGHALPALDGARLKMTAGDYDGARSALSTGTFNLQQGWSTNFRLSFSCANVPANSTLTDENGDPLPPEVICPGDGIGFVVTAGPATQLGNGGFGLGYETPGGGTDFTQSLTFGLKTFWDLADYGVDGVWQKDCCSDPKLLNDTRKYLDDFDVSLSYNAVTGVLATNVWMVSSNTLIFSNNFSWMAPAWASDARVGFTAASGIAAEQSWVSNWTLQASKTMPPTTVPEPSTVVLLVATLPALWLAGRRRRRV